MKVYDRKGLQELLGVGRDTALSIMRSYGFRTGYAKRSPLRITDKGVEKYAASRELQRT